MKKINQQVSEDVLFSLENKPLFRYYGDQNQSPSRVLEKAFCDYYNVKHALVLNSCSSAIFLSLVASGVKPNDQVLMPAFTFVAVPSAIVNAGAIPVLVEVTDDYVIDPHDFVKKLDESNAKFLLLSHMRGRVADLDAILAICLDRKVKLIEDCAHGMGVFWDGFPLGSFGVASSFSTQSHKILDSGEGGVLITNDDRIAWEATVRSGAYEQHWKKHFSDDRLTEKLSERVQSLPINNFRMSNIVAATLLAQMNMVEIERRVQRFNQNYAVLENILSQSPYISLPKHHPKVRPNQDSIQFAIDGLSPIQQNGFLHHMKNQGYNLSILGLSSFNARCFWSWKFIGNVDKASICPHTRQLVQRTVDYRLHLHLEAEEIKRLGVSIVKTLDSAAKS